MNSHCFDTNPIQTYKSYRAEKFEKYIQKVRNLKYGIYDSNLKPEDKEKLEAKLIDILSW